MTIFNSQRREFLRKSAAMSAVLGGAGAWGLNLAAIAEAAAQNATQAAGDYKALVCVFLYGGNDYGNTLVPYDSSNYAAYQTIRSNLALLHSDLDATVLSPLNALPSGRQMALAPQLAPLKTLFDAGKLGMILNIGSLIQPTTLAQYKANSVPLPPKLFSHNDQQSFWQSSNPEGATSGWGGRMADLMASGNGNAMFSAMSVSGNAVFLSGKQINPYAVTSNGSVALAAAGAPLYGSAAVSQLLLKQIVQTRSHAMANAYAQVMQRSLSGNATLQSALTGVPTLQTVFDAKNALAMQLKMVAKLIAARAGLGVKRQVFFVSLSGFDTHKGLLTLHPPLLSSLSSAMSSFYNATVELGVGSQVTTFTASDFGRTLAVNGDGSDHGWGSHHFIMGDAVAGQQLFGTLPATAVNGSDDVGQGRLLPSTSIDQLGAALASWFGVAASDMSTVLPFSGNFDLTALKMFR